MKEEKEIRKIIKECEDYLLYDREKEKLNNFPFFTELNNQHISISGVRRILLWVLNEQPKNCRSLGSKDLFKDTVNKFFKETKKLNKIKTYKNKGDKKL